MMEPLSFQIMFQLTLATLLGFLVGLEREYKKKPAGLRTHSLVALGSALFTILSVNGFGTPGAGFDPSRVAAQIVVGVGFIGAGLIFVRGGGVYGLTTATSIWTAAAIGMAVGLEFYTSALFAALLVILILWGMKKLEHRLNRGSFDD